MEIFILERITSVHKKIRRCEGNISDRAIATKLGLKSGEFSSILSGKQNVFTSKAVQILKAAGSDKIQINRIRRLANLTVTNKIKKPF